SRWEQNRFLTKALVRYMMLSGVVNRITSAHHEIENLVACGNQSDPLPNLRLSGLALSNPVTLNRCFPCNSHTRFLRGLAHEECLRSSETERLEVSRLEEEVEALRVVAPLLSEGEEAGSDGP